jgi:hypothetical protein
MFSNVADLTVLDCEGSEVKFPPLSYLFHSNCSHVSHVWVGDSFAPISWIRVLEEPGSLVLFNIWQCWKVDFGLPTSSSGRIKSSKLCQKVSCISRSMSVSVRYLCCYSRFAGLWLVAFRRWFRRCLIKGQASSPVLESSKGDGINVLVSLLCDYSFGRFWGLIYMLSSANFQKVLNILWNVEDTQAFEATNNDFSLSR